MAEAKTVYDYLLQRGIRKGMELGIQKGIQEGLQKGIQEGVEKGRLEGAVASLRQAVLDVLKERFGRVPRSVRTYVQGISDLGRLNELVRQAVHVDRPQDLLDRA